MERFFKPGKKGVNVKEIEGYLYRQELRKRAALGFPNLVGTDLNKSRILQNHEEMMNEIRRRAKEAEEKIMQKKDVKTDDKTAKCMKKWAFLGYLFLLV